MENFKKELAELINRHCVDSKLEAHDFILADVAVEAMLSFGRNKKRLQKLQSQDKEYKPEQRECNCPACRAKRAGVPVEILAISEALGMDVENIEVVRIPKPKKRKRKPRRNN